MDTDPGTDDAVALAALLASDDVEVAGVTTVAGNSSLENTTANALSILELFDRADVPVASGCERPLNHSLSTTESIHGPGGLRGDVPAPRTGAVDTHAVEFILERARNADDDITLACLGPLTNVATALSMEPDLPSMVEDVILMGGAVLTGGNATPAAEYNFYADPVAASRVLQETSPMIAGLNVTNRATLPVETIGEFKRGGSPLSTIGEWCDYPSELEIDGGHAIHDAAVSAQLLGDVLDFESYPVSVVVGRGPCRGAAIADMRPDSDATPNARVAVDIDVEKFRDVLVDTLAGLE